VTHTRSNRLRTTPHSHTHSTTPGDSERAHNEGDATRASDMKKVIHYM
jgi:hypothetical protein